MMEQQEGMDHTQQTSSEMQGAARLNVGAALREARERMGMSVEDVAGRLKFAPRQIVALEDGNFEQLPQMAFIRGFVRSYARLVQIDEIPLLDALPSAPAPEAPAAAGGPQQLVPAAPGGRNENILWLAGALVVALLIGIVAWRYGGEPAAPTPPAGVTPMPPAKPAEEAKPSPGQQPPEEAGATQEVKPAQPAKPGLTTKPAQPQQPAKEAKPRAGAKGGAQVPAPRVAPASSVSGRAQGTEDMARIEATSASAVAAVEEGAQKRTLRQVRLEFDEDSWAEVKDAKGKILLSIVGVQGTTQSVSGVPPMFVTIGNAKGVRLYYKGEPVDVQSRAYQNVAHVTLE